MNCLNNSSVESGVRAGAREGLEVGAWETTEEEVKILLPLVESFGGPSASSSLPPGGQLQQEMRQVRVLATAWSKGDNFFFQWG